MTNSAYLSQKRKYGGIVMVNDAIKQPCLVKIFKSFGPHVEPTTLQA